MVGYEDLSFAFLPRLHCPRGVAKVEILSRRGFLIVHGGGVLLNSDNPDYFFN